MAFEGGSSPCCPLNKPWFWTHIPAVMTVSSVVMFSMMWGALLRMSEMVWMWWWVVGAWSGWKVWGHPLVFFLWGDDDGISSRVGTRWQRLGPREPHKIHSFTYNIHVVMHASYLILGVPSVPSPRNTTSSSESVSRHIRGLPRDFLQNDDMATILPKAVQAVIIMSKVLHHHNYVTNNARQNARRAPHPSRVTMKGYVYQCCSGRCKQLSCLGV